MTKTISVDNEYGKLERVAVHSPGEEIARMRPDHFSKNLFDDILSPRETEAEHAVLRDILEDAGAEVLQMRPLLGKALDAAAADAREDLLRRASTLAGNAHLAEELSEWGNDDLAEALINGLSWSKVGNNSRSLARLRALHLGNNDMAFQPTANLMFMRDPCISFLEHLIPSHMSYPARSREPLLVEFALRWGLSLTDDTFIKASSPSDEPGHYSGYEGGDFLILSRSVIMIGASERTSPQAIDRLSHDMMAQYPSLQRVYVVLIPDNRSMMHLDTLLTQVDERHFLGYTPVIVGQGHATPLAVAVLERDQDPRVVANLTVQDVLREEFGHDITVIPCGGNDPVHQAREQWTDGANGLCLAPGDVLLYGRNQHTIGTLKDYGFTEVKLSSVQSRDERRDKVQAAIGQEKVIYSFIGSELSRARGGPRCLTMPLKRQSVDTPAA